MARTKTGSKRWVKIVALYVVLAMVVGGIAASLFLAFSGGSSVVGTYTASDGRSMTLSKDGVATLTIPSINQPITAAYEVEGDVVTVYDPATGMSEGIRFRIEGRNLVIGEGQDAQAWTRQEKK